MSAAPTSRATPPPHALHPDHIRALAEGRHPDPHDALGPHRVPEGWVVRALRPLAASVVVVRADGTRHPLAHVADGLWQAVLPDPGQAYRIETAYGDGSSWTADDPYRFVPTVGEIDRHLWGEGRHEQLWHVLGAHVRPHEGVEGTSFSVWAPNATKAFTGHCMLRSMHMPAGCRFRAKSSMVTS